MPNTFVTFTGDKVALIVRGKTSETHAPKLTAQHADATRSNGSPVGYFGGGDGPSSGGSIGMGSFISGVVLIGTRGEVFELDDFKVNRPHYVDSARARAAGCVSTALVLSVANGEADRFDDYWDQLKADPGTFRLLGKNCSTRASGAFRAAGLLAGGIPGLDTPNNLYKQLRTERGDRCTSYTGYVGFVKLGGNTVAMQIAPVD